MTNKEIREKVEEVLRNRILFIGNEIPNALASDNSDKQVYSGYPAQLVDQIMQIVEEEREKVRVQEIKDILKVIKDLNKRSEKGDLVGMGDLEDMLKGYLIDLSSLKKSMKSSGKQTGHFDSPEWEAHTKQIKEKVEYREEIAKQKAIERKLES